MEIGGADCYGSLFRKSRAGEIEHVCQEKSAPKNIFGGDTFQQEIGRNLRRYSKDFCGFSYKIMASPKHV